MQRAEFWDRFVRQQWDGQLSPLATHQLQVLEALQAGPLSKTELKKKIPTLHSGALSAPLEVLERQGLIEAWEEPRHRIMRALTEKGRRAMDHWLRLRELMMDARAC